VKIKTLEFLKATKESLFNYCTMWRWLCASRTFAVISFFATSLFLKRADKAIVEKRDKACESCNIFNHTLKTCGTPGKTIQWPEGIEPYGCWCFMPVKGRFLKVNCWMAERTQFKKGWAKELNGNIQQS